MADAAHTALRAADALAVLRAATRECAAAEGRSSSEQTAEGLALADALRGLSSKSTVSFSATPVRDCRVAVNRAAPLPHLPTELLLQVVRHLDVRDLGRFACTCRQLYYGPPCPPRPTPVVEEELRRRAEEAGRWLPSSPPAGMGGWVPALLQREWRDSLESSTVAAGDSPHSLFVDANGALLVCGFEDDLGTLGLPRDQDADNEDEDDEFRTVLVPTPVPSMASIRIRQVVAGCYCSLAVSEAGGVYIWGENSRGRLASDRQDRLVPTLIQELSHHRVREVAIEDNLCAAVTEEGLLITWATASETFSEEDEEERMPQLGLGLEGTTIGVLWPPRCVTALQEKRVGSVAVGHCFTLVSTEAGAVFSFGDCSNGSLGHGDHETHSLPKRVEALDGVYVATVATGYRQSLALTACGRVFWWGARITSATESEFQLVPQLVDSAFGGERVRSIAASFLTSYAVTDADVLFSWGCDGHAHDGNFPLSHQHCQVQLSPWPVAGLHGIAVVGVSVGHRHTLALAADGSVHASGLGKALGIGWGVGGQDYPEGFQGDPTDETEGQQHSCIIAHGAPRA